MTIVVLALMLALALAVMALALQHFGGARSSRLPISRTQRILFPFVAQALSTRALDAALRLANAEDATLVPTFIALVPWRLPLDTTPTRQCEIAIALQEAIEHRATEFGVPVDARIQRGRTYRHALRQTIEQERFDRIVIAAAANGSPGFDTDDVAWLLHHATGEIVVLRPSKKAMPAPPARAGQPTRSRGRRNHRTTLPAGASNDGSAGGNARQPPQRASSRTHLTA